MKFYFFLLECKSATLRQIWNGFGTPEMMCLVLSKLPGNTREKRIRNVMNIRQRHSRESDFGDITGFVDDDATFANDPLFSKVALSGCIDKKEAPNQKKQQKTYITAAEEKTEELVNVSKEP